MGSIKNFGRFYAILRRRPEIDKDDIVMEFTDGRTTHLRDMRADEYTEMCNALDGSCREAVPADDRELRRARSSVLLRLGRLGISTIDNWEEIDAFCLSPKIAGMKFAAMDVEELKTLVRKLESIIARGGLKRMKEQESMLEDVMMATIGKSKFVS